MPKISLRTYDREIEALIEQGQRIDEAIAHCAHILELYPKHIETHRLLAQAYLEAKRYEQAADSFEHVLASAPEDFVSHLGLGVIAAASGRLDDAIWHMERAFEAQPSNAAVQAELQRLFGRRDGVEPPKIRLTRAALAHMYMHGELYSQAISEAKAVLLNDSKRADMQCLLAKAYFRNGQQTEAIQICTELLDRYPYCLDANRLMAETTPGTQPTESVQQFRQRITELDPYAAFAKETGLHPENAAESEITLDRLEYLGPEAGHDTMRWTGLESDSNGVPFDAGEPSWLSGGVAQQAMTAHESRPTDDIPPFLRRPGRADERMESEETPVAYAQQIESMPGGVPGELPAWIRALAFAQESDAATAGVAAPRDPPDWLRKVGGSQSVAGDPAAQPLESADSVRENLIDGAGLDDTASASKSRIERRRVRAPTVELPQAPHPLGSGVTLNARGALNEPSDPESKNWIEDPDDDVESRVQDAHAAGADQAYQQFEPEASAILGSSGTSPQEQDDALAWLDNPSTRHGGEPDGLLNDSEGLQSADIAPDEERTPFSSDLSGLHFNNFGTKGYGGEATDPGAENTAGGVRFDWESDLAAEDDSAGKATGAENAWSSIMEELDAPDWLVDVDPNAEGLTANEGGPGWLGRDPTVTHQSVSDELRQSPLKFEAMVDHPDWIEGLDAGESISPPEISSQDEVPPWLRAEVEPQPESTERRRPTEWQRLEPDEWSGAYTSGTNRDSQGLIVSEPSAFESSAPARGMHQPGTLPAPGTSEPSVPRPHAVAPNSGGEVIVSLGDAQSALGRGNIAAALNMYGKLIRKGKSLEEIIPDLRDALYRYPVEVPIWQALGDAYMRANRLQEALDAYTKAEELLR